MAGVALLLIPILIAWGLLYLRDIFFGKAVVDKGPSRCASCSYPLEGLFAVELSHIVSARSSSLTPRTQIALDGSTRCPECGTPLTIDSIHLDGYVRGKDANPARRRIAGMLLLCAALVLSLNYFVLPALVAVFGYGVSATTTSKLQVQDSSILTGTITSKSYGKRAASKNRWNSGTTNIQHSGEAIIVFSDGRRATLKMPESYVGDRRGWLRSVMSLPDGSSLSTTDYPTDAEFRSWLTQWNVDATLATKLVDEIKGELFRSMPAVQHAPESRWVLAPRFPISPLVAALWIGIGGYAISRYNRKLREHELSTQSSETNLHPMGARVHPEPFSETRQLKGECNNI